MALDGIILARAREKLEKLRKENELEQERRLLNVYAKLPEVYHIDGKLRSHMSETVRLTLSRTPQLRERLGEIKAENLALQARRKELLHSFGYADGWLDPIFSCPRCHDTGDINGEICSCLMTLYNRELTEELGVLLKTGDECFENFDLSLYGNAAYPMKIVFETCREYAANFDRDSINLLFQGGTGLGKTYLSACIARVVAQKGCSVCYDTASAALDAFELRKFARDTETAANADARVSRMLDCDLMILDDLGTEMLTSMSVSALYTLLNTRLVNGKKTVISTNLTDAELARRYTPQIVSRIEGEFTKLPFSGQDIRRIK